MKEITEFKKGDYIVLLYSWSGGGFHTNYIFKQEIDQDRLYPEVFHDYKKVDLEEVCNWTKVAYNLPSMWRYATPAEIFHYNSIKKPFNVSKPYPIPTEPQIINEYELY